MRFGKQYDFEEPDYSGMGGNNIEKLKAFMFDKKTEKWKVFAVIAATVAGIIALYCAGFLATLKLAIDEGTGLVSALEQPIHIYLWNGVTTPMGIGAFVLFLALFAGVAFLISHQNKDLNQIKESDERGVDFSSKGVYGTAGWMSKEEAKKVYEITHIDDVRGVILAQFSSDGKEVICLPENTRSNRNILILGSPGTGKSWCYVRNAIFQSIVREESLIVTDPKGELYESTASILKKKGYKVWVFNLVNPQRSDAWNILGEIYDPETGNISEIRVTEFCDTVMKNTIEGPDDGFWGAGESNLFKAMVMYCAWNREQTLNGVYEYEAKKIINEFGDVIDDTDKEMLLDVFEKRIDYIVNDKIKALKILLKLHFDGDEDKADQYINELQMEAPACDIASVYNMIVTTDIESMGEKFKDVPVWHPAGIAWSIFKNGPATTGPGFVQGLAQRLQLFQAREIRRITTNDTIRLEDIGKDKVALFCVISDKSTAMRALTSLFFNFAFKDIADAADRYGPQNRRSVNVICDEFANLGVIPSFDVTISTVRSRKINISIILQSVMQLQNRYGDAAGTIMSCCDTTLFLGCNDPETANHISDLSGLASIRVVSTRDNRYTSIGNRAAMQGYGLSEGDGKRNLLNPDEVRRLSRDEVLLYHNGHNILKANRCGYENHIFARENPPEPVSLRNYPLASEKYAMYEGLDAFLGKDFLEAMKRNKDKSFQQQSKPEMPPESDNNDGDDDDGFNPQNNIFA